MFFHNKRLGCTTRFSLEIAKAVVPTTASTP